MSKKTRTLSYNPRVGTLHIKEGDKETGYYLDRPAAGVVLFTKIIGYEERTVTLSPAGNCCTCPGHRRWAAKGTVCRHIAAVLVLRERGRLS